MAGSDRKVAGSIELQGYEEVMKRLSGLEYKVNRRLAFQALRKASRILIVAARQKIQSYSKTVAKSIAINYQSRHQVLVSVGPKKTKTRDPWYAHFIEFGVSGIGRFKGKGKQRYRADQPARPFMRPAYDETHQQIIDDFGKSVMEVIDKYTEKTNAARTNI